MEVFDSPLPISSLVYWFLGQEKSMELVAYHQDWLMEIISIKCENKLKLDSNAPYEILLTVLGSMWSIFTLFFYLLLVPIIVSLPVQFVVYSFFDTEREDFLSSAMAKFQKSLDKLKWDLEDINGYVLIILGVYFWYDMSYLMTHFGGFPRC